MLNFLKSLEAPRPKPEPESSVENYLKEGVKPIMASILTFEQFEDGLEKDSIDEIKKTGVNTDYFELSEEMNKRNIHNDGPFSYCISPLEESDKFSEQFRDCTGLVAVGIDRKTGKNISFMTHQNPEYFIRFPDKFLKDLEEKLNELKERSEDGTIDAVIFGGNYFKTVFGDKSPNKDCRDSIKNYRDSIRILSLKIESILNFEPIVISGPKTKAWEDNVYFNNCNRRLFIVRDKVGQPSTDSFFPSEIKKKEKKWEKYQRPRGL